MAVRNAALQLPHVNLPAEVVLSRPRYQLLLRHHNTLLDGLTVNRWFLEELFSRQILTSRQKRSVENNDDQRAKAGFILEQVYKGSDTAYDNFQLALKTTNQESLAKLIQPVETSTELSLKSEQDMMVKLQKNKHRLKREVENVEELLQLMARDDLISREEKETALVRRREYHVDDVLDLLYNKGLSVMQHFVRLLGHQGYQQLSQDIDNTTTDIEVPSSTTTNQAQEYTMTLTVRMIKVTKQQQRYLEDLPNELTSVFRPQSGKISKYLMSRYKLEVTSSEVEPFRVRTKVDKNTDLSLLQEDYHSGALNTACNDKIKAEKFIKRSDCKWLVETDLEVDEVSRLVGLIQHTSTRGTSVSDSESDSSDSEESEDSATEVGDIRIVAQYPLVCGCNGDGSCVRPTRQGASDKQVDTVAFNVLVNKIKSHTLKGKTKNYNYSAVEIFREIRNPQRANMDYAATVDNNGYNILHITILEGRMDALQVLSNTGVFGELMDSKVAAARSSLYNLTCMDIARKFRMTKAQDEITKYRRLETSMPTMHKMARIGDLEAVKLLLQRHPQMMETRANDGSTAIYWAVMSGSLPVIQALKAADADLNVRTFEGETLLGCAVRFSHKEVVQLLVKEHNLDPEQTSAEDKTPITIAIENKDLDLLRTLAEVGAEVKAFNLPHIVQMGRTDMWIYATSHFENLDINHCDAKGKSPLMYACENANKDIFNDLIRQKANMRVRDKRGRNILYAAIESSDLDFFKMLLDMAKKKKLDKDFLENKDNYLGSERCFLVSGRDKGILGYHYLEIQRVYLDIFRSIIRSGGACDVARYGEVFKSGWGTPPPEVKKEVDMRYDTSHVKVEEKPDMTPLHFALVREQPKMAVELIRAGADVDAEDCFGLRPVHLACMRGYLDVLSLLEENNANVDVVEQFGMTPVQVAEANRHYELQHFFKGAEDIKDSKLQGFRNRFKDHLKKLDDGELHKERRQGKSIKQVIISILRDLSGEINTFFYELGTSQIQVETRLPSPPGARKNGGHVLSFENVISGATSTGDVTLTSHMAGSSETSPEATRDSGPGSTVSVEASGSRTDLPSSHLGGSYLSKNA